MVARREKIEVLRSRISGTASMMKSAEARSSMLVVGVRRERVSEASDWDRRALATSFSRSLSVAIASQSPCLYASDGAPVGLTCELQAFVEGCLGTIDQSHWYLSLLRRDECDA